MHLYISADTANAYFIDTIKEYCANSHGRHTCIFLPDIPSPPGETHSTKIVHNVFDADLILIDATPHKFYTEAGKKKRTVWFTNEMIIFEFAMAVTLGKSDVLKVYCLVSPDHLYQVLRERVVDPYPLNDKVAFLDYIDKLVVQLEQDPNKVMRQSRNASFS